MSMGAFYAVVLGSPGKFAFMFTLGNVINIAAFNKLSLIM
jgi:hypothetical protein